MKEINFDEIKKNALIRILCYRIDNMKLDRIEKRAFDEKKYKRLCNQLAALTGDLPTFPEEVE